MKNKILIIALIIAFIGLLLFASVYTKEITNKEIIQNENNTIVENIAESNKNSVIEVDESNFQTEVLGNDKTVLIDFYATWCGPCKILSPIIDEVAEENDKVKFVRIDVDKCNDLVNEYGIQYMPTLVLIKKPLKILHEKIHL